MLTFTLTGDCYLLNGDLIRHHIPSGVHESSTLELQHGSSGMPLSVSRVPLIVNKNRDICKLKKESNNVEVQRVTS